MTSDPNPLHVRLELASSLLPPALRHPSVLALIQTALAEDLSERGDGTLLPADLQEGDVTSVATIPPEACLMGHMRAKASGIACGLPLAQAVFAVVDPQVHFVSMCADGEAVHPGTMLAEISGNGRAILIGERSALNFAGRMSGVASLTRQFVEAVAGTQAVILDTRKTIPNWRLLDKYAVRCGGGQNHRYGLYDMVLVKDNHISGAGGISPAVERVRERFGARYPIEVEVKDLDELDEALALKVERIMLDNMDLETMRVAVQRTGGRVALEASGNVSLATVRAIAETGVDFISSGSLTHSAPVLDISMKIG